MIKEKDLPDGWFVKQFVECIEKKASSNKLKIQKNSFQNEGEYAIIDQSVKYIAGYTDDYSKLYKGELPVIIFGDHTRIFKFVDFPFALGADGTKILVPKKDILHPKYFYYFLLGEKVENHGYSRHYKFLKEKRIVVPPLQTQMKIVAILEKAERLKEWRKEADELTDEFLKSTFLEMFGDPYINEMGWDFLNLKDTINSIRYGTGSPPEYSEFGIPFIRATNIKSGRVVEKGMAYISQDEGKKIEKCRVKEGDLLIVRSGVNTGECAIIDSKYEGAFAGYDLIVEIDEPYNTFYNFLINSEFGCAVIEPLSRRAGQPHLNSKQIMNLNFYHPPIELQQNFASIVQQIEQVREHQGQSRQHIDDLFNVLMQKAFKGELM